MRNILEIFRPKYSTREILVSPRKVKDGENYVRITKDKNYKNKLLKFNSEIMDNYPCQPNGRGEVVCIPISEFEIINEE